MKKSLIVLFTITVIFICFNLFFRPLFSSAPYVNQLLNMLYLWSPGFVGLYFAKKEGIKLPIFKNIKMGFFIIPLLTFVIVGAGYFLSTLFGVPLQLNESLFSNLSSGQIGARVALFFVTGYLVPLIFFSVILLGGEIFWRGYLWEKLKNIKPFKAIWLIALIWFIWQLPLTYFSYSPGFSQISNLGISLLILAIISPLLFYYRVRYQAIVASALFYAALFGAFLWVVLLCAIAPESNHLHIYGGSILAVALLFSLALRLYSPKRWEQIK